MKPVGRFICKHWPLLLANAITSAAAVGLVYWLWLLRDSFDAQLVVIWTVGSVIGLIATTWTLVDSWAERAALPLHGDATDEVLATLAAANVRREAIRVLVLVCPLWIGISVLGDFSNPTVSRSLLIVLVALLIVNSLLDRLERYQTSEVVRRTAALAAARITAAHKRKEDE